MNSTEKIEASKAAKDLGNTFFKAGRFRQAQAKYKSALGFIEPGPNFSDEEKLQLKDHKLSLYLNLAAVKLKVLDYKEVIENCNKALGLDQESVKALFRRAQALFHTSLFVEAKRDLTQAAQLSPQDKDIRQLLDKVNQRLKVIHDKEKKAFSNMFASD